MAVKSGAVIGSMCPPGTSCRLTIELFAFIASPCSRWLSTSSLVPYKIRTGTRSDEYRVTIAAKSRFTALMSDEVL